jgi:3-hydroxyisobutyrate dehydrogenase
VHCALNIFVKDMDLVQAAGRDAGSATQLAESAQRLYAAGAEAGLGGADDSSMIQVLRASRR